MIAEAPMDAQSPIAAWAAETGLNHAGGLGTGTPIPVPAWRKVESIERWLPRAIEAAGKAEPVASATAEWLLDNAFQVQRAIVLVKQDLLPGFYNRLRPLAEGPAMGEPLILAVAHDVLQATHFQLSRETVLAYLEGYQKHLSLNIAELWALPVMLRIACLERLVAGFARVFPALRMPLQPSKSCQCFLDEVDPSQSVSRGIANLGIISSIAWKDIFDRSSLVEQSLAQDPCGVYLSMDFETRDAYRNCVERLAARCDLSEVAVASHAVALARRTSSKPDCHVGHWLAGVGLRELENEIGVRPSLKVRLARRLLRHPGIVYTVALFLLGVVGLAAPAAYLAFSQAAAWQWVPGIALSALPATVLSVTFANWLVTNSVAPRRLPKLDFSEGIDPAWPTLVVVPVIVGDASEVSALVRRLEAHRLANPEAKGFVLLSDPSDAQEERTECDAAVESALRDGVEALNRRYGTSAEDGPFCLLHRARQFNPAQGCWMAWERKRGKLEQFNRFLLTSDASAFAVSAGCVASLPGACFVVTADADTRLPPESVARLAATLAHPLNRPHFEEKDILVSGYTVLQPRVEIAPEGNQSMFARLFGGDTAIDIYSRAVSDVYQDLVGTGNFVGKGIYDVAAFLRSLEGRIPENNLLSHDLWEGLHGRAGLVSDVIVYESFPTNYGEFVRRWHRWVRGDWQLLPWLFPTVPGAGGTRLHNRLSLFDRLRIWDNMRRSLVPASVLALLLGGWFLLPGNPLVWTALAVAAPGANLFTDLVSGLARGRRRGVLTGLLDQLGDHAGRWALSIVFLVSDTVVALHAIGVTLFRLGRGRLLLEWTSAAHVSERLGQANPRLENWRSMWVSPVAAILLAVALIAEPPVLAVAAPLLCLWMAAPEIAWLTGRRMTRRVQELDADAQTFLRLAARRGWLFFELYARPEDNWLPPDNHQEAPIVATAHRTSPTNIGMMVLSALSAWRMGHIGTAELLVRMREMLDTLDRLEHWRGHILNWYQTTTLAPLEPRYVSTVDSGNLAVSLVTLAKGCEDIAWGPAFDESAWQGLDDCLALLGGALDRSKLADSARFSSLLGKLQRDIRKGSADHAGWPALLQHCSTAFDDIRSRILPQIDTARRSRPETLIDLRNWLERSGHHLHVMRRDMEATLPWLARLAVAPAECEGVAAQFASVLAPEKPLRDCAGIARDAEAIRARCDADSLSDPAREWLSALAKDIRRGLAHWRHLDRQLGEVSRRASSFAYGMDFTPLYDPDQRLFHIGYDLSADRIDQHHYDLLASEARLASLFAIAKQDVPLEHWFQLGRPITKRRRELALVSWNGSMFEYLMPTLFLRSKPGTLLEESDQSAVDIQRRHGAAHGIPWGISESGFASVGPDGAWRYRAFGVPELGLRRGLGEDLVVAPYASALALAARPHDAVANLRELADLGALGLCGFHEALDFTGRRRVAGQRFALVQSYMAHHQGMIIAAIANVLYNEMFVTWFHADPRIQAVDILLHERVPWELPPEIERVEVRASSQTETTAPRPQSWEPRSIGSLPAMHVLGNGRLATIIGGDGSGEMRWTGQAVTRPGEVQGGKGQFLYLRDSQSGKTWSPTSSPLTDGEDRRTLYHAHKVEFHSRLEDLSTTLEVLVAPVEDVEIRRLRLVNSTSGERTIEVASHAEIALAAPDDYLRHPAFAKLFVTSRFDPSLEGLLFQRRARSPGDATPAVVQRIVGLDDAVRLTGWETARSASRARHGDSLAFPSFPNRDGQLSYHPLDPVASLQAEVTLLPHGAAELAIVTAVGASMQDAVELARRYGSFASLDWANQDAALRSARDLHDIGLAPDRLAETQLLFSTLLARMGPRNHGPGQAAASRDGLWALGLSGDLPILLLDLEEEFDAAELRFILAAHRLWRGRGLLVDLVLLHAGLPGYIEPVRERLIDILRDTASHDWLAERGGIHLFGRHQLESAPLASLRAAAAVLLADGVGPIASQLERRAPTSAASPPFTAVGRELEISKVASRPEEQLRFSNGLGGFTADGSYRIDLSADRKTPAPWANVLASRDFGAIVTEAGLGCTFAGNSGENRLTPWHNDPLNDPQGEAVYLRDEDTGEVWSISPLPAGDDEGCRVEHRLGTTVWTRESAGLEQTMTCSVAAEDPVKIVRIRLSDRLGIPRRITATFFADWLLGAIAGEPGPFRSSRYVPEYHAILAQNRWQRDFAGRVAFLTATLPPHSLTTSRQEFLGHDLDWRRPQGLTAWDLGDRTENHGADAGAAFQVHVDITANASCEFAFVIGEADGEQAARELIVRWQDDALAAREPTRVESEWAGRCGALEVTTPDPAFDLMVNRWLPYQAISSRLFARAGFYQAGGAFGFRDQLQDVLAMLLIDPGLAREQILRAAAHQFEQGDVLHWWHPPSGRGVRTRCSDDLLWLPHATARYIEATGDSAIFDERVSFLHGVELSDIEHDRYAEFPVGGEASLYDHCLRAFERAWRLGAHGLPLIGDGDWNDGLNRVGKDGKGESVWLGWFFAATIRDFARVAELVGHSEFARRWLGRADLLVSSIERHGWDGEWYVRAFDDMGRPWGSRSCDECRIDSLAQSWAVIAGGGDLERAGQALDSAFAELVRAQDDIVRLLDPPFDSTPRDPGYIKAYPPGIRENGGQYSHAAAWLGIASAMRGDGDRAKTVFDRLNPILHSRNEEDAGRYLVEPYVVAADIAGSDPYTGRGGWSWYTGAAAWSWRLAVEHILGIRLLDGKIELKPCPPTDWEGFSATIRGKGAIELSVKRGDRARLEVDGKTETRPVIAFPGEGLIRQVSMILARENQQVAQPVTKVLGG